MVVMNNYVCMYDELVRADTELLISDVLLAIGIQIGPVNLDYFPHLLQRRTISLTAERNMQYYQTYWTLQKL